MSINADFDAIQQAANIAIDSLNFNKGKHSYYASPKVHKDYWLRDSIGIIEYLCHQNNFDQAEKILNLFREYSKEDVVPLRIEESHRSLRLFGFHKPHKDLKPAFKSSAFWATQALDQNPLYVISSAVYYRTSENTAWIQDNIGFLTSITDKFLNNLNGLNLIEEGHVVSWADQTLKQGSVSYTNVIGWKALEDISFLLSETGKDSIHYEKMADTLKSSINENLWTKNYYADWLGKNGKRYDNFFLDSNVLAVLYGLADADKSAMIFDYIKDNRKSKLPGQITYKRMDLKNQIFIWLIHPFYKPTNVFPAWGCLEARAAIKAGHHKKALEDTVELANMIIDNNTVPEVLFTNGKPVWLPPYKSENNFAWAAAEFLNLYIELSKFYEYKII